MNDPRKMEVVVESWVLKAVARTATIITPPIFGWILYMGSQYVNKIIENQDAQIEIAQKKIELVQNTQDNLTDTLVEVSKTAAQQQVLISVQYQETLRSLEAQHRQIERIEDRINGFHPGGGPD